MTESEWNEYQQKFKDYEGRYYFGIGTNEEIELEASDVVKLLNGAFKEGVMSTLIQYKINLDELPKVEI